MRSWDIFCRVVDNYGDVGVCWRLARQLACERGDPVRLWIDDLGTLARIQPGIQPAADRQRCEGIDLRRWRGDASTAGERPHDVVIEAFACETPPAFVEAMVARQPAPAWINLEYLSAESWVEGCHRLPSPHPYLPIVKHFYFPGFSERTGGLIREHDLFARRDAFLADAGAQGQWWRRIGIVPPDGALKVSLFSYPNAGAESLLRAWIGGDRPVVCVLPEGILGDVVTRVTGRRLAASESATIGHLTIHSVPFVPQDEYDAMLWACDVNFVRGEDSFVRAQWAARPMVWHIYPQPEEAHRPKLHAFLERYAGAMDGATRTAVVALFQAWNGAGDAGAAWSAVEGRLGAWSVAATGWSEDLAENPDLATGLADFVDSLL